VRRIRINAKAGHDRILIVDPAGKPVTADAGSGNDYISSGPGHDHLYGGPGRDWIQANAGRDFVNGGIGDDTLEGGPGDDILAGDLGSDRLFGQTGNDFFYANDGQFDMVDGGIGTDEALVDKVLPVIDGRNSIEVLR
jgi:Ca2+-binding RTX toxin-like protein